MAMLTGPFDIPQKDGIEIRIQQAAVKIWRGGAVGQVGGVGYATPLVITTAGMLFIGVCLETSDNTNGVAGTINEGAPGSGYSSFVRVARKGSFAFNQSGITQASIGQKVWFSDDNTITLTPGEVLAGIITTIDEQNSVAWVDITNAVFPAAQDGWIALSGSADAISPHTSGNYIITKAGVDAMTLAAPTATVDDSKTIVISSSTLHAHTLTATNLLSTGGAAVSVATFAAYAGAGLTLKAYQGLWQVVAAVGITFS
jgi:hypothetical protein